MAKHATPEAARAASAECMRRIWADPEKRAARAAKISATIKRKWDDPAYRAAVLAMIDQSRAARIAARRRAWADPEKRAAACAKISAAQKRLVKDPAERARRLARLAAARARLSEIQAARKNAAAAARREIEVPSWVPGELVGDYLRVARRHGEEKAASLVRRLKREMREEAGRAP